MSRDTYSRSMPWLMLVTMLALTPGVLSQVVVYGAGTLLHLAVASIVALLVEVLVATIRNRRPFALVQDWSAVVTAALIAVAVPAGAPWWVSAVATASGLLLAKHLYGGLGQNLFNPAMAGYAVALVSFPEEMTRWYAYPVVSEGFQDWLLGAHAATGATPLDLLQTAIRHPDPGDLFGGATPMGMVLIAAAYTFGGAALIAARVIHWRMPLAFIAGLGGAAALTYVVAGGELATPSFHLLNGAAAVVAFFIVTDPVTAPVSPVAQWCFAGAIGVLVVAIRTWGDYAEGAAFAVLAGNMLTPALDRWLVHRPDSA